MSLFEDYANDEFVDSILKINPAYDQVMQLLDRVDDQLRKQLRFSFEPGTNNPRNFVCTAWMGGSRPEYRNRGILSHLLEFCHARAREKGFRYVTTEAASSYSQMVLSHHGYRPIDVVWYRTFAAPDGRRHFAGAPSRHPNVALMVLDLSDMPPK